jgi:hypothetical protein
MSKIIKISDEPYVNVNDVTPLVHANVNGPNELNWINATNGLIRSNGTNYSKFLVQLISKSIRKCSSAWLV